MFWIKERPDGTFVLKLVLQSPDVWEESRSIYVGKISLKTAIELVSVGAARFVGAKSSYRIGFVHL